MSEASGVFDAVVLVVLVRTELAAAVLLLFSSSASSLLAARGSYQSLTQWLFSSEPDLPWASGVLFLPL